MIIAFLGPDGTGKSTMKQLLAQSLRANGACDNVYEREFRFSYIPTISELRRKRSIAQTPEDVSQNFEQVLSPFSSSIIIIYYTVDYFLHRIVSLFSKDQNVYVFARYWYDYEFQRGHQRAPRWLLRLIEFFVPRPDFIFYLNRSPDQIFRDKPELPIQEIERQQAVILQSRFAMYREFIRVPGDTPAITLAACLKAMDILEAS